MSRFLPLFVFVVLCVRAQQPATPPGSAQIPQGTEIIAITPDTVVATVNGRPFTAGELEHLTRNLPPDLRKLAGTQPKAFLEQYAVTDALAREAEKLKIDQTPPYRERLADARRQILANSVVQVRTDEAKFTDEELRKYYEAHKADLTEATARVIFISRVSQQTNLADGATKSVPLEDIKLKVAKVAKLAKEGGDFIALAKQYSDDRDSLAKDAALPYPIRASATDIPQNIRDSIFSGKPGEVVGPVEHPSGWYLFRVDSIETAKFEAAKGDIERDMKKAAVQTWVEAQKKKTSVTLDHKPFWDTFLAASKEALEADQKKTAPEAGVAK